MYNFFYSPLEANLLTDSSVNLFFGAFVLETSSVFFAILGSLWFSLYYLLSMQDFGKYWDTSESHGFLEGLSGFFNDLFDDTFSGSVTDEENSVWSGEALSTLIFYVGISNLTGLLPWGTSTNLLISAVLVLTWSLYLEVNLLGIAVNKFNTVLLFLASGASIVIQKVLWLIELLSYLLRAITLGIRIYANLLAGHSLVHILLSGVWYFLLSGSLFLVSVQSILVMFICFLEIGVGLVQAYVLAILITLYLGEHIRSPLNH